MRSSIVEFLNASSVKCQDGQREKMSENLKSQTFITVLNVQAVVQGESALAIAPSFNKENIFCRI